MQNGDMLSNLYSCIPTIISLFFFNASLLAVLYLNASWCQREEYKNTKIPKKHERQGEGGTIK